MGRIVLLLLFVGLVFPGMAQKIIAGKVFDESNSIPLQRAIVTVKGMTGIIQTNKDGMFRMYIPDSIKALVIKCTGFMEKEVSIDGTGWMDIRLKKPCFFDETFITVQKYYRAHKRKSNAGFDD